MFQHETGEPSAEKTIKSAALRRFQLLTDDIDYVKSITAFINPVPNDPHLWRWLPETPFQHVFLNYVLDSADDPTDPTYLNNTSAYITGLRSVWSHTVFSMFPSANVIEETVSDRKIAHFDKWLFIGADELALPDYQFGAHKSLYVNFIQSKPQKRLIDRRSRLPAFVFNSK